MGTEKLDLDVSKYVTPDGQVMVTCITNILDPFNESITKRFAVGTTLNDCLKEFFPDGWGGEYELVIAKNGSIMDEVPLEMALNAKYYTLAIVPQGGGRGTGKALMIVAAVLIAVATYGYGAMGAEAFIGFGGTYGVSVGTVFQVGVAMLAAGYSMISYEQGLGDYSTPSPTYTWNAKNEIKEGSVWPILYGTTRITPPMLGRYIDVADDKQYLNILFGIADHAIDSISDIEVNDNPLYRENGNNWWPDDPTKYFGLLDQKAPGNFCSTRTLKGIGIKFSENWTTVTFPGNAIQGLSFALSCPAGLYAMNSEGVMVTTGVSLDIEYRRVGTSTWHSIAGTADGTRTVNVDRWSGGCYYDDSYDPGTPYKWLELEIGSENQADHTEGERYYPADGVIPTLVPFASYSELIWRWIDDAETVIIKGSALEYIDIAGAQNTAIRRVHTHDNLDVIGAYEMRFRWHNGIAPESGASIMNATYLEYVESILYDDFAYPGASILPMRLLATDKLSSELPPVTMIATRSTVPVWTGAAYENKPANNPAWASYDMLHNDNYGAGIAKEKLIYADFAAWASFCTTNSYTCNIYFDTLYGLRPALDTLSTLGRGHVVQRGSKYGVVIDSSVAVPVQGFLFNQANMIKDSFKEEWISQTERLNVLEIKYRDAALNYADTPITLYADDYETTTREVKVKSINLVGCTNQQMALYHGRFLLNISRYISTMFSWVSDVDAIGCIPGQIVEISHDRPQIGYSGRVVSGSTNSITLDREVTMQPGTEYSIVVRHIIDDTREEKVIAAVAQETTTNHLHLKTGTWTTAPAQFDMYAFGQTTRTTKLARIISITKSQELRRQIKALEYFPEVYSDTQTIGTIENPSDIAGVIGLRATEVFFPDTMGGGQTRVVLSWTGVGFEWFVYYRVKYSGTWKLLGLTKGTQYVVMEPLTAGTRYDFSVTPSKSDAPGQYYVSLTYRGKPGEPLNPTGLTLTIVNNHIVLNWTATTEGLNCTYDIKLSYEGGEATTVVEKVADLTWTYPTIPAAGTYTFYVYTRNPFGELSQIEGDTIDQKTIEIAGPSAPSVTHSTNGETVELIWNALACKGSLDISYWTVNNIKVTSSKYSETVAFETSKIYSVIAFDVAGNFSSTTAHTVTIPSSGAVTAIATVGYAYAIRLQLSYLTFPTFQAVEIWGSRTTVLNNATLIGETTGTFFDHTGLNLIDTWYYWTRIRDTLLEYGEWYPRENEIGVRGDTLSNPENYLEPLFVDEGKLSKTLRTRIAWIDQGAFVFGDDYVSPDTVFGMSGVFSTLAALATTHDGQITDVVQQVNEGIAGEWIEIKNKVGTAQYDEDQRETAPTWDEGVTYYYGDFASHDVAGVVKNYMCIEEDEEGSTGDHPDTSPTKWQLLSGGRLRISMAEQSIYAGQAGKWAEISNKVTTSEYEIDQRGLAPVWVTTRTYILNEYVSYETPKVNFKCIKDTPACLNKIPTTETSYWERIPTGILKVSIAEQEIMAGKAGEWASIQDRVMTTTYTNHQMADAPAWSASINYYPGQYARYGLINYLCIVANLNKIPPDHSDEWTAQPEGGIMRISMAEGNITAGMAGQWAEISNKLAVTTYNTDQLNNGFSRIAALENRFLVYDTADAEQWVTSHNPPYEPGQIVKNDNLFYRCKVTPGDVEPGASLDPPWYWYWDEIDGGLLSRWTLKFQTNNNNKVYMAGIGMELDGEGNSELIVISDKFKVLHYQDPDSDPVPVFAIGHVGGNDVVGISGDLILDGSLLADAICSGSIKSADIELAFTGGNCCIRAGKTDFSQEVIYGEKGFILGLHHAGGGVPEFFVGGRVSTGPDVFKYLWWNGSDLIIEGDIIAGGNIHADSITTDHIVTGGVETPNIHDYAVSRATYAESASSNTVTTGSVQYFGGNVFVFITINPNDNQYHTITLKRNGSQIMQWTAYAPWIAITWADSPGAGTFTYSVENSSINTPYNMYLQVLEIRK